jgi:hypothetical protein
LNPNLKTKYCKTTGCMEGMATSILYWPFAGQILSWENCRKTDLQPRWRKMQ